MNSVETTGEVIVMEAEESQVAASDRRKSNSSADFGPEMHRARGKKQLTPKRKEIIQNFFSKIYANEEVKQRYGPISPANKRVLKLIKETLNRKATMRASKVTQLDIRDWIINYPQFFNKAEQKGREEYNLRKEGEPMSEEEEERTGSKKRLTPKRREIIREFFSKTYARKEVQQCYGPIALDNQRVLGLIAETLNVKAKKQDWVTHWDIHRWIVEDPQFFKEAEEKGREEYKLRKEAEAMSSKQEVASGSGVVAEVVQPVTMELDPGTDENDAGTEGSSPLSEDEKLALAGLLGGVEAGQSGNFLQPPVSFQSVTWISHVLASTTEKVVKGNVRPTSNETFEAILDGARKTCDIMGNYFQSLKVKAVNKQVKNEEVQERTHG